MLRFVPKMKWKIDTIKFDKKSFFNILTSGNLELQTKKRRFHIMGDLKEFLVTWATIAFIMAGIALICGNIKLAGIVLVGAGILFFFSQFGK